MGAMSREPALTVRRPLLRSEAGVGVGRFRCLLERARAVFSRHLVHRVDRLETARSAAGHDDDARPLTGADEDVVRPRRAVDEVPCLQPVLLTFDHEHALSGNEKEILLAALAVVHAVPLAGHEHMDAEAELSPLLPAFKVGVLPALLASDPRNVARVEDEPALTLGDEPGLGSPEFCPAKR